MNTLFLTLSSSFSYPCPTKGLVISLSGSVQHVFYHVVIDSEIVFTADRLPDVNPPWESMILK
jgi:hypothetical protein